MAAVLSILAELSGAQQPPLDDFGDLPLEELVQIQVVSATSRRPQAPRDAPAVVMIVTGAEIRRHGYRTLGEVLCTLPGFYVTNDRNYSYLGVRGFGLPGDYNTRILLLVNGTRTNDNIYDEAFVAREFILDADLIERVEVSKGPGASVYGNSAFFAVVNVVTKRGRDLGGVRASANAASFGTFEGSFSYGRRLPSGLEFVVSATALDSKGQTLSFPEFSDLAGGTVRGADSEHAARGYASLSFRGLGLEAAYVNRRKGIPTASYGTIVGDTRARTRDELLLLTARYETALGENFDLDARLSSGAYDYVGDYPYETGPDETDVLRDFASGRWLLAEASGTRRAGKHTLLLGGEYQNNARRSQSYRYLSTPQLDLDVRHPGTRFAVFAQDDIVLTPKLLLSLGGRYDRDLGHEDGSRDRLNPRLAVIAFPDAPTTVKLLYGRAFRAPNEYESHYYAAQGPDLEPETIETVELAAERALGARFRLAASIYSNSIEQLITLDTNDAGDLFFRNSDAIESLGGELSLDLKLRRGVSGRLSYALQRTRNESGAPTTNSPRHQLLATLSVPFAGRRLWASADALYLSDRQTPAGTRSSAFALVNLNLLATRLPGNFEVAVTARNLFDTRYSDPASAEHRQAAIEQDGRSLRLELSRRF